MDQSTSISTFKAAFPDLGAADFPISIASAPGRVNVIGEHIDYNGYAVLPCAISQRIVVMAAKSVEIVGQFIRAKNADSKYIESHINIVRRLNDFQEGDFVLCWSDYLLCGYYAATTLAKRVCVISSLEDTINGLCLYVDGNIPSGSGLSSSSAMVVASALAILNLWGIKLPMKDIAQSCIEAERLIGTMGGGMDQTISCLAIPGKALLIKPGEQVKEVTLPDNVVLVLADSMIRSEKGAGSKLSFNTRVVECKLASIILAALLGCTNPSKIRHINELELTFREKYSVSNDSCCLEQLIDFAHRSLREECYTIAQIEKDIFDVSGSVFSAETYFSDSKPSLDVLRAVESFKIKQRCIHVLTEALRVKAFTEICSSAQSDISCLGLVLNESHVSLRDLYECSCVEVDRLQNFSLKNEEFELHEFLILTGALGCRIVGAGWGGMTVSLVEKSYAATFIEKMKCYYQLYPFAGGEVARSPEEVSVEDRGPMDSNRLAMDHTTKVFVSIPSGGADVILVNQ